MSWLPLILAAWLVTDAAVVATFVGFSRHRASRQAARLRLRDAGVQAPQRGSGPVAH